MRILVVSPHADDETLGAGGLLLKMKTLGSDNYWLNFTDMTEAYGYASEEVSKRAAEIEKVKELLSISEYYNLGLKPAELDGYSRSSLIVKVADIIKEVKPDWVILPFYGDIHTDHGIVFDTVVACTKSFRYPFIKKVLMMEVVSETEFACGGEIFRPNFFVDISEFIEKKKSVAKVYESEMGVHPFPRSMKSIESLAAVRGANAGCEFAEAFMIVKEIMK